MARSKLSVGTIAVALLMVLSAAVAHAVPTLGVATEFGYVGSTGQTGLDPYQDYFVNTFIPGTDATHGYVIGASGEDLIVYTNVLNADIWLLTTEAVQVGNAPTLNGNVLTLAPSPTNGSTQFDGYTPTPYYGLNLGPVDTSTWTLLPSTPFTPDPFYSLNVILAYSGSIAPGQYFFSVADATGGGYGTLDPNGRYSDPFSPKTTSATGHKVPEPTTLLLLGSGLLGLGILRRRRA